MLRGSFGPVHPFQVKGWAYDSDDLSASLDIEVQLDGQTIGITTADVATEDPRLAGLAGNHGFILATKQALPIAELHRLTVTARGAGRHALRLDHAVPPRPILRYPLPASDPSQHPVFILGSVRSGTTAIMEALSSGTRYAGPGEGHLLDLLMHMSGLVEAVYAERRPIWEMGFDTLITAVPEGFMLDAVRHGFVELARARFPNRHWFDKTPTPTMIRAAPLFKAVWPEARFVFMKRRGIENMLSRLRRCPEIAFDDHCRGWADSMASWVAVREALGTSAVEIEHLDVARQPGAVAKTLGGLLALTAEEQTAVRHELTVGRPERSTESFAAVHDLATLPWTGEQIAAFRQICGPAMRQFGYGETRATYRENGPIEWALPGSGGNPA